jgi:hypothetical protein
MNIKYEKCTPMDYSQNTLEVYYEVADKKLAYDVLIKLKYVKEIIEVDRGYRVRICYQQIPEIIRVFMEFNIAIYAITPDKSTYEIIK